MTDDTIREFIASVVFTPSKDKSHEWLYCPNGKPENRPSKVNPRMNTRIGRYEFVLLAKEIRKRGYIENYKGRDYTCLNIDGWKYWTMGAPLEYTIILNRAKL